MCGYKESAHKACIKAIKLCLKAGYHFKNRHSKHAVFGYSRFTCVYASMSPASPVNKRCRSEPPRPGTPETSAPIHPSSSLCNTVSTVTKHANLSLRLLKQQGASCSPALLYSQNQTLPYFNRWHIRITIYLYKLIQGHNPDRNVSDNMVFIRTQHSCCCLVTVLLLDVGAGLPPRRGSKRRKQSYTWPLSSMLQCCVFLALTPSLSPCSLLSTASWACQRTWHREVATHSNQLALHEGI